MQYRLRRAVVCLSLIGLTQNLPAAQWEVVPKLGYGFQGSRDLANPYNQLNFSDKSLIGLSVGFLKTEKAGFNEDHDSEGQLELSWSRSDTAFHIDRADGAPADRFDVRIDQLHLVGLVMTDPPPWQPYVLIGAGATRYKPSNGQLSTETRFSFTLGGGIKWLWSDNLGLRLEGRWVPALALKGSDFFCDQVTGTCYSIESNSYASQVFPFINALEFTTGIMLRY